jgi:dermatan/chondrotin sulfate uronyl 2-O-sulfotransferase UST
MGIVGTFSKYAWIPYLFLCMGLVVLFGTEEWLLFHYKTPNEFVVMESKFYANQPIEVFRRALDELDEEQINLLYSAALTAAQTRPVTVSSASIEDVETTPQILAEFAPRPSNKLTFEHAVIPEHPVLTLEHPAPELKEVELTAPPSLDENVGINFDAIVTDVHRSTVSELRPLMPPLGTPPLNQRFVFHNKIPKAGSTTMKWLLVGLSKRNKFELDHQRFCIDTVNCKGRDPQSHIQYDGPDGEVAISEYVPKKLEENQEGKYLLLKHHHWLNFTEAGLEMPTYINIARDPVTRFASWYYFERYGWGRQEGQRDRFNIQMAKRNGEEADTDDDRDRTLDECVLGGHEECLEPVQVLVKYFCGTVETCSMMGPSDGGVNRHDWKQVAIATERAKNIIVKHFHVVGVLENFEQTLELFEKMLPEYFDGARDVYQTPMMKKQRESTKSHHRETLNETRQALEKGVLRYEVDIYNLIKSLFFEKLQYYNIPLPE